MQVDIYSVNKWETTTLCPPFLLFDKDIWFAVIQIPCASASRHADVGKSLLLVGGHDFCSLRRARLYKLIRVEAATSLWLKIDCCIPQPAVLLLCSLLCLQVVVFIIIFHSSGTERCHEHKNTLALDLTAVDSRLDHIPVQWHARVHGMNIRPVSREHQ